jgi:hypothetical protein
MQVMFGTAENYQVCTCYLGNVSLLHYTAAVTNFSINAEVITAVGMFDDR